MDPRDQVSVSTPSKGEAGKTGDWRSRRPVVDRSRCSAVKAGRVTCQICWVYCPDNCISRAIGPDIDLDHCKGCGICAEECPTDAITMVPEHEAGTCGL